MFSYFAIVDFTLDKLSADSNIKTVFTFVAESVKFAPYTMKMVIAGGGPTSMICGITVSQPILG